jgi:hypothetical protein
MTVTSVPAQTIVVGELAQPAGLGDLLTLCMAMGLEVVSVRRLPGETATRPGAPAADPAAAHPRGMPELMTLVNIEYRPQALGASVRRVREVPRRVGHRPDLPSAPARRRGN